MKLLAVHRQAKPDQETAAAYLVALQDIPADVLEHACKDLGYAPRGEYEHAWPELGVIRTRCESILRIRREREESRRLLNEAPPDPVSPERMDEIMAKFRAVLKRKVMP